MLRKYKSVGIKVTVFGILAGVLVALAMNWEMLGREDFTAYWSAASLLKRGANPYDLVILLAEESKQLGTMDRAMPVWNPPCYLTIFLPFTFFPFEVARILFILCNFALFLGSVELILTIVGFKPTFLQRTVIYLLCFGFEPVLITFYIGQLNLILSFATLSGIIAFLGRRPGLAGIAFAIPFMKPHVCFVLAAFMLLQMIKESAYRLAAGFLTTLTILSVPAILLRPTIFVDWMRLNGNPFEYHSATLGMLFKVALPKFLAAHYPIWPHFVLSTVGLVIGLCASSFTNQRQTNFLILLFWTIVVNVACMPYGWAFDYTILLLPMVGLLVSAFRKRSNLILNAEVFVIIVTLTSASHISNLVRADQLVPWSYYGLVVLPLLAITTYNVVSCLRISFFSNLDGSLHIRANKSSPEPSRTEDTETGRSCSTHVSHD